MAKKKSKSRVEVKYVPGSVADPMAMLEPEDYALLKNMAVERGLTIKEFFVRFLTSVVAEERREWEEAETRQA